MIKRRWLCAGPEPSLEEKICRERGILRPLAAVLINRGISSVEEVRSFLAPSLEDLHPPCKLMDVDKAAKRILGALERDEKVVVYGDYDVDGITASAILKMALSRMGGDVDIFLPSRFREGYGLEREALLRIREGGCSLLVTVDCGINSVEEVRYARELGMDVIVTDHHHPLNIPLEAAAVVNPLRDGCGYPWKQLAGVGVAFKLLGMLAEMNRESPDPHEYLDLVALGTVADLVPLKGENRILASFGLKQINTRPRPGLKALMDAAGTGGKALTSRALAFILAPALNAAGRMGEALPAASLLMETDYEKAVDLAHSLVEENLKRRRTEQDVLNEARQFLEEDPASLDSRVIVLGKEGWHHGVLGIAASRLLESHYRPVVMVSLEGDSGKGSARSIPGFNITAALHECEHLLDSYGGHEQAAGLTLPAANLTALREALNELACRHLKPEDLIPRLMLDGELDGPEINLDMARQLEKLAPFGQENPPPYFCSRGWEIRNSRLVGRDSRHLKMGLRKGTSFIEPIFFSGNGLAASSFPGRRVDLAFTAEEGRWGERPVLNLELIDIAFTDAASGDGVEIIDQRESREKLAYLKSVMDYSIPRIFTGTAAQQERIRRFLPDPLKARFIHPRQEPPRENETGGLCEIVLYHLPLNDEIFRKIIDSVSMANNLRIHMLYNKSDREINRRIMEAALPSSNQLKEFCLKLKEPANRENFFSPEQFKSLEKRLSFPLTRSMFHRCLSIMEQVGWVIPRDGGWDLAPLPAVFEADELAASSGFRESMHLRRDSGSFQDFLLGAGPGEIWTYIKKLRENTNFTPGVEGGQYGG